MYDYREYFMAIAAIFLALALGILIGISFGEDYLVSNQREIIELMEKKIERLKGTALGLELELQHWEAVKPAIWRGYSGALSEKTVALLAHNEGALAAEIAALFRGAGATVTPITIPPRLLGEAEEALGAAPSKDEIRSILFAFAVGEEFSSGEPGGPDTAWPPDCYVIVLERDGRSGEAVFLRNLWQALQREGARVIAAFPWDEHLSLTLPEEDHNGASLSLVDNIDTLWGRVALLEMLMHQAEGYYGFGRGRAGLIPATLVEAGGP